MNVTNARARWTCSRVVPSLPMLLCLAGALLVVYGCSGSRSEIVSVIVCAGDAAGIVDLKALLSGLAAQEGFELLDGSEDARRDLETLERSNPEIAARRTRTSREPVINIRMIHDDGREVAVSNAALPGRDVFLAIQGREQDAKARVFAQELADTLGKKWTVHPNGPVVGICDQGADSGA